MSFFLDSGANSGSPVGGGGASPAGGASAPKSGAGSAPPPNDGGAPNSSVPPGVVAAPAAGVAPVALPYNLSMLSNNPVLVITVAVALSSSPTALSTLCCCNDKFFHKLVICNNTF